MNYKIFFIFTFYLICSCAPVIEVKNIEKTSAQHKFKNSGFTLVYNDNLYNKKIVSKKIDDRSLVIFQKNLKKDTLVKIINLLNEKSIIAKVGDEANYPSFNNSVISKRISNEIELDIDEPYIEILEIVQSSSFIAKKAKTFEEEKKVADKAPIDSISINTIGENNSEPNKLKKKKKKITKNFNYVIIIADFYYKKTAQTMIERIKNETSNNKGKIKKLSKNLYRVYLGPYSDINSLQKSFNDIKVLEFENIQIKKND